MGGLYLLDLPDVIEGAGLSCVVVDGWEYRANTKGGFDGPPVGIVEHHTAGNENGTVEGELSVLVHGNSSAPGPIASLLLWRDAVVYVVAGGRCNHAGEGGPWRGISSMNSAAIGIEQANNGVGETWAAEMVEASNRLTAALVDAYGMDVDNVISHMEWAPTRKIDPAGPWAAEFHAMAAWVPADMSGWRAWTIDSLLTSSEEDDLAITLFQCSDADAAFVGASAEGVAVHVSWADADMAARYRAVPTVKGQDVSVEQLQSMVLLGRLPEGDTRHRWDGTEFAAHVQ